MKLGKLEFVPIKNRPDLIIVIVRGCLELNGLSGVLVAEIDPRLGDTTAFCEHYKISMGISANCVVVEAKRANKTWYAACLVLATTRADINGVVRRELGARKTSFAPTDKAVLMTSMEYGGITPIGLPNDWPILIDQKVIDTREVIIGSGIRGSKLLVPSKSLLSLPNIKVLDITKNENS